MLGTKRGELNPSDSGFSQWLAAGNASCKEDIYAVNAAVNNTDNVSLAVSQSPIDIHRDNTPSSLQRPDKHSQHSSLQNIQGDLNDILDRLQNMVANDCLLDGKLQLILKNCSYIRGLMSMYIQEIFIHLLQNRTIAVIILN